MVIIFFYYYNAPLVGALKGGVSVECRDHIFYTFGCHLENHSVDWYNYYISLNFIFLYFSVFWKVVVECRGEF